MPKPVHPDLADLPQRLFDRCEMLKHPIEFTENGNLKKKHPILTALKKAGIQASRITSLTRGKVPPDLSVVNVLRMAEVLDVSTGWLLSGEEPMSVAERRKVSAVVRTPRRQLAPREAQQVGRDRGSRHG